MRKVVEQNVADASAENDAKCHPKDEIVEVGHRHGRFAAPQFAGADEDAGVTPAEQNAEDVGEGVPADGERAEMHQDGIERRVRNDEQRHRDVRIREAKRPCMW